MSMRHWFVGCTTLGLLLSCGCVERTLSVQSNPSGALLYLNDQEVGRTPLQRDFLWYGTYSVTLRKEGFETVKAKAAVIAPWYEWVPFDLVAELLPFRLKDKHYLQYDMKPQPVGWSSGEALLNRADQMRGELERSRRPATRATTRPTTQPAHH